MGAVNPQATSDPAATDEAREIVGLFRSLRRHLVRGSRAELARSGLTAAQVSVISLLGTNSEDRRYVQISLAEHVASQAPALGDEGPTGRLEAVLKAATAEERRKVQEGLVLLVRFADQARILPTE
jgi:hypothetical protein